MNGCGVEHLGESDICLSRLAHRAAVGAVVIMADIGMPDAGRRDLSLGLKPQEFQVVVVFHVFP
jgi:hypothetical protein